MAGIVRGTQLFVGDSEWAFRSNDRGVIAKRLTIKQQQKMQRCKVELRNSCRRSQGKLRFT
jgi:hypothetical protein